MMIVDEDVGPGGARVRARPRRAAPLRASDPTKGTRASRRYPRRRGAPPAAAGGVRRGVACPLSYPAALIL